MTKREAQKLFLLMWDHMVRTYNSRQVPMELFSTYRTAAEKLFFHLFKLDMAFCCEVARGYDPEENS